MGSNERTPRRPVDWTADAKGKSNSSEEYVRMVSEVEMIIRESAHSLIAGRVQDVARVIVSTMAHKHGYGPREIR